MEFNTHFAVVQGVLRSQEKVHGKLVDIKQGNDNELAEIKTKLLQTIEKGSDLEQENNRRLYLLLLFNTDCEFYEYLYDDLNCGHIVGLIPKLSKYLFIEIVNHLNFLDFVYESIVFLPPVMSIEVVDMCLAFIKSNKEPFQLLKWIDVVVRAVFLKLVDLYNDAKSENAVKSRYFEFFLTVLENFNSSKTNDFRTWKENKLYYLSACVLKTMASIVNHCCKYYLEPVINREVYIDIYDIKIEKELKEGRNVSNCDSDDLLKECVCIVLSKLLATTQSITVMVWMAWTEMEEFTDENVQVSVGNDLYNSLNFLKETKIEESVNSHLHSELLTAISNLAIKPTDEDDEINSADMETMLNALNDPTKTQAKWLSALINREDYVADARSLGLIREHSHMINDKDFDILLTKCIMFLKQKESGDLELEDLFKTVVLTSLDNFHVDNQIVILKSFINKYGLTDVLKTRQFESRLTEVFNQIIDMNEESIDVYTDLIRLCMQSPTTVVNKSVKMAVSSAQHGKVVLKLLKILNPICSHKLSKESDKDVLSDVVGRIVSQIETLSESEINNYANLVVKLVSKDLINGNKFLKDCLMPKLYKAIESENWNLVLQFLEILKCLIESLVGQDDNGSLNLPVFTIFLCQLIDKTRGSLSNFAHNMVNVCDKAIVVLYSVLESFDVDNQEIFTLNWMKQELQKLTVITQMHVFSYIDSSSLSDHISKKSIEVYWLRLIICGTNDGDVSFLFDMRRDSFVRTLCKVLPLFTFREWKILFTDLIPKCDIESLCGLIFATLDAILLLEAAVIPDVTTNSESGDCKFTKPNLTPSANLCLHYCIQNLIHIIQDVVLTCVEKISMEVLAEVLIKIGFILQNFPSAAQNYSSWILLKVLQNFINVGVQRYLNSSTKQEISEINKFCAGISLIPNAEIRQNLSKIILSIQNESVVTVV